MWSTWVWARERVLEAVPLDEQARMYEVLAAARRRVAEADIENHSPTVTNETDRSLAIDSALESAEHTEE